MTAQRPFTGIRKVYGPVVHTIAAGAALLFGTQRHGSVPAQSVNIERGPGVGTPIHFIAANKVQLR